MYLVAVVIVVGLGLMVRIIKLIDSWPTPIGLSTVAFLVFCVFGGIPLLGWYTHRLAQKLGMDCPHCRKSIAGMSALVIATGKCGHCGETVLIDKI